jgi:hypothetical protein
MPHRNRQTEVFTDPTEQARPVPLVPVQQPYHEFFKDEGGKGNVLSFTVKSPIPLDA